VHNLIQCNVIPKKNHNTYVSFQFLRHLTLTYQEIYTNMQVVLRFVQINSHTLARKGDGLGYIRIWDTPPEKLVFWDGTCDAPIRRVRRRHCDVYTQVRNTLTYIR